MRLACRRHRIHHRKLPSLRPDPSTTATPRSCSNGVVYQLGMQAVPFPRCAIYGRSPMARRGDRQPRQWTSPPQRLVALCPLGRSLWAGNPAWGRTTALSWCDRKGPPVCCLSRLTTNDQCEACHYAFVMRSPVMDLASHRGTVLGLPVPCPGNGALLTIRTDVLFQ
jgi:hypothetical protein